MTCRDATTETERNVFASTNSAPGKSLRDLLEREVLATVTRPGRYIGSEMNIIRKPHSSVDVTVALAFPDVYEIGMSNLGVRILYEVVNRLEWAAAERVFAPWVDMEQRMREEGLPLYSLETFTPAKDFDILGFSLAYELCYTNVLNMLDLAGIPLRFEERAHADSPLVIAGGLGSFVPEPMWEFIDLFVVGEAEEAILDLLRAYRSWKRHGGTMGSLMARLDFLRRLASEHEGMYVPHLYVAEHDADGTLLRMETKDNAVTSTVHKRTIPNLKDAPFPEQPIIPLLSVVHDRAVLEVMRGCARACRFCQAGVVYRPVRELPAEDILQRAEHLAHATGYEEISLSSLSTGDHSGAEVVVSRLSESLCRDKVALSLPSLRPGTFSVELLEKVQATKKTGVTLAVEAATPRLRNVINKKLKDQDILDAARAAYSRGWNLIKVYFMIGLPTETQADLTALAELVMRIGDARRKVDGKRGQVNVSIACFIPKAHTPFQWEGFCPIVELDRKISHIRGLINRRNIKLKFHDPQKSYLEAVFSRGDRRLSQVIHRAWLKGCRFDDWSEHFRFDLWMDSFRECGVDPDFYACRERSHEEVLPWDHISSGVDKDSLMRERRRARSAAEQENREPPPVKAPGREGAPLPGKILAPPSANTAASEADNQVHKDMKGITARVMYRKFGLAKFIGHLDTVRVLHRTVRRARIRGAYSQGFSPKLRLSFSPPLPLGFTSDCEFFDVKLANPPTRGKPQPDRLRRELQAQLPEGFCVQDVRILEGSPPSLFGAFWAAEYEIELPHNCLVDRRRLLQRYGNADVASPDVSGTARRRTVPTDCIVRTSVRKCQSGSLVVSLVLRQDMTGKGGLRRAICDALEIEPEVLERCLVHKKKVYAKAEQG